MSRLVDQHGMPMQQHASATPHPSAANNAAHMEMFSFGDPVPVLDQRASIYFGECSMVNQKWYSPPMDLDGLALTMRASPHHASALYVKRNILVSTFEPHPLLSQLEFSRFVLDFLVFGNGYIERQNAMSGRPIRLRAPLAKYMRVGKEEGEFYFVTGSIKDDHQFDDNLICHLMEPDINQEVYGSPEYLSAMNAAWLDEAATLFRRKYYLNGSHAGFIMYVTDPAQNKDDIDNMRKALKESKGVGNFRNLFLYSPNGKKDGIQILPISEVAAKDEFWNIKEASRVDIAAVHRVPPQLMGATPTNTSGFGDVEKAARVFVINELIPLQQRLLAINEWLGQEVIRFKPYQLQATQTP
jgi:PBSX family phage portal protein